MPTIFFSLLNNAAKQKDFQGSAIKCSLIFNTETELTNCWGLLKIPIRIQRYFFPYPVQGSAVLDNIKLSQKVTQVWSCAPKTLTAGRTELPVNRPGSILGMSGWGLVIQHKAVTPSSILSWPVSNYSVGKQQNFSSKRTIQNRLTSK